MTTDKPDYGKHIDRGDGFTHHAGDDCHPDNRGKTAEIYQTTGIAPAQEKPVTVGFTVEGKKVSRDEFLAALNAPVQEDKPLKLWCEKCRHNHMSNTIYDHDPVYRHSVTPPSQSESGVTFETFFNTYSAYAETHDDFRKDLAALIEQEKRAAVDEALLRYAKARSKWEQTP